MLILQVVVSVLYLLGFFTALGCVAWWFGWWRVAGWSLYSALGCVLALIAIAWSIS